MSSARDIKRRIQSVKNTQHITKAMKMVSAAKLYKSQKAVLAARPYSKKLHNLLAKIASTAPETSLILMQKRPVHKVAVVLVTGNRGLAGGFNGTLIKRAMEAADGCGHEVEYIAVGSKGRDFLARQGKKIVSQYCEIGDTVAFSDVKPIGDFIVSAYEQGSYDQVIIVYQAFLSAGHQEPRAIDLLPVSLTDEQESQTTTDYLYEGRSEELLQLLAPKYVYSTLFQMVMESKTSEHVARMTAMSAATDNAADMLDQLQLDFNRSRQAAITREISEIISGVNALKTNK